MKNVFLFIGIIFIFSACLKEEKPVLPPKQGDIETKQIEIGYPYKYQVYYDCKSNEVVRMNNRFDWDLSFESGKDGFHILANTARGIFISNLGEIDFETIIDSSKIAWNWDDERGDLSETAIGDWRAKNEVFIIDLQYDLKGHHLGYKKLKILDVSETKYHIKSANLDGSAMQKWEIIKNQNLNFVHFSFKTGTLELEPDKNDWDLLFSNHYHKFSNLPYPFVLTQVLINKENGVKVAENNDANFKEIVLADTSKYEFTNYWDEIGYDWKIRNGQDNSFTIDTNKYFIIKDTEGYFFKLRFIDFYNQKGEKGYPRFEIQLL